MLGREERRDEARRSTRQGGWTDRYGLSASGIHHFLSLWAYLRWMDVLWLFCAYYTPRSLREISYRYHFLTTFTFCSLMVPNQPHIAVLNLFADLGGPFAGKAEVHGASSRPPSQVARINAMETPSTLPTGFRWASRRVPVCGVYMAGSLEAQRVSARRVEGSGMPRDVVFWGRERDGRTSLIG